MRNVDAMLIGACALQVGAAAVLAAFILRPQWLASFVSDAFLFRHSLWDECDSEPMNVWAEELERRDGWYQGASRPDDKGEKSNG
jgi:hypothetical protein